LFYGIETTEEWLIAYTKTHWNEPDLPASNFNVVNLNRAIHLLQRHSGVHTLGIKTVLPQNSPIPPARRGTRLDLPKQKCGIPIITICSSVERSFKSRPAQVKVNVLKQIMGGKEPMWWVDDQ
jgi:hypothetical protein